MSNKTKLITGVIAVISFVIIGIIVLNQRGDDLQISVDSESYLETREVSVESTDINSPEPTAAPAQSVVETEILVHVCGCVNNPGVYRLDEKDRVFDAVEKAGGFSEDAREDFLNLAGTVEDGTKIYVPSKDEVAAGIVVLEENQNTSTNGLVNINTASKDELMTLNGVGESKAESIISYRKEHGGFKKIEDIMNIPGIKDALFSKIKEKITV